MLFRSRCHPNYLGGVLDEDDQHRPWFDWCEVLYELEVEDPDSDQDTMQQEVFCARIWIIVEYNDPETNQLTHIAITEVAKHMIEPNSLLTSKFSLDTKPG